MTLPIILRRKPWAFLSTANVRVLFGASICVAMTYFASLFLAAVFFGAVFFGALGAAEAAVFTAAFFAAFFFGAAWGVPAWAAFSIWRRMVFTRARSRRPFPRTLVSSRRFVKFLNRFVNVSFARLFSSSR